MAKALGVAVVPYSPTGGGLLTGKYAAGVRPEGARFATNRMYQTRYADEAYWSAAEAFVKLAKELGYKPATLAVAWVAAHPAVTSVILGARSVEQLEDTLAAAGRGAQRGDLRARGRADAHAPAGHRPQRGARQD
jgi:aryl-alcohol dehydrogenase-like predicted oxidoreductase